MNHATPIVIEPDQTATAAVIWLHGLGASGSDFVPIVPELQLPADIPVRFVFPHAPNLPVTVNGGYVMPAWYDILDMSLERIVDEPQLLASASYVHDLIARQVASGIPARHIVIAGFSQGGAVAYQAALTYPEKLAGLLCMSTYLATADSLAPSPANRDLPITVMHGRQDPVVPEALGKQACAALADLGYHPDYLSYNMEHQVCPRQIADISAYLQRWLSAPGPT